MAPGKPSSLFPPPCKGVTLYSNIFACFQGITSFNTRHFSLFYGALSSIVNGCSLTLKKEEKNIEQSIYDICHGCTKVKKGIVVLLLIISGYYSILILENDLGLLVSTTSDQLLLNFENIVETLLTDALISGTSTYSRLL